MPENLTLTTAIPMAATPGQPVTLFPQQTQIVLPILSPFSVSTENHITPIGLSAFHAVLDEQIELAREEANALSTYRLQFKNPNRTEGVIEGATAHGLLQRAKQLTMGFNDVRQLSEANKFTGSTALGVIPSAVERAMARARLGGAKQANILDIGSGNRLVPWSLKRLYGDAIRTHELSPVYAQVPDAIDVELPAGKIQDVELPTGAYDLVYSIVGSYYAVRQLGVWDNVLNSLAIGGEAFLVWKANLINRWARYRIESHARTLQQMGIDVSFITLNVENADFRKESYSTIWLRKRAETSRLQEIIRGLPLKAESNHGLHPIRFALTGPYMSELYFGSYAVKAALRPIISDFAKLIGISLPELAYKLRGKKVPGTAKDPDEFAIELISEGIIDNSHKLHDGIPLSVSAIAYMSKVITVINSKDTVDQREARLLLMEQRTRF